MGNPGRGVERSGVPFPGFIFGVGSFLLLQKDDVSFRKCNQQRFGKVDVVLYRFVASLHGNFGHNHHRLNMN